MGDFGQISAHLPGFCPLLKHGFGQGKWLIYGLFWPFAHFPTFFLKLL
jgi:hypothetical protein